jgi:dTDP-4-dehydrorhamnose reductase
MIELCIEKKPVGIYNLGSSSSMSKAEFAQIFASKCGLSINLLRPVSINNIDFLYAFRPRDMRLNCSLFEKKVNIKLTSLIDEIDDVVKEYV